jgi:large subunit ribosomal protein L17
LGGPRPTGSPCCATWPARFSTRSGPFAEKLITLAKRDDDRVHARRLAGGDIQDRKVLKKLFDTLGPRFSDRAGGYTRILRLGPRPGDAAEMAIVELIGSEYKPKKKEEKGKKKGKEAEGATKEKGEKKADKKEEAEK